MCVKKELHSSSLPAYVQLYVCTYVYVFSVCVCVHVCACGGHDRHVVISVTQSVCMYLFCARDTLQTKPPPFSPPRPPSLSLWIQCPLRLTSSSRCPSTTFSTWTSPPLIGHGETSSNAASMKRATTPPPLPLSYCPLVLMHTAPVLEACVP